MKKYILTGDIIHSGRVEVIADSKEEAIKKAADGDFKIYEACDPAVFVLDSEDDDHVRELGGN